MGNYQKWHITWKDESTKHGEKKKKLHALDVRNTTVANENRLIAQNFFYLAPKPDWIFNAKVSKFSSPSSSFKR